MKPKIIGPNRIALQLGTGFQDFTWNDVVEGMLKEEDDGVTCTLLAAVSLEPGRGNMKLFIADLKKEYRRVNILDVMSPKMEYILIRQGFTPFQYHDTKHNEFCSGYKFQRE